jgi:hypothetical protein
MSRSDCPKIVPAAAAAIHGSRDRDYLAAFLLHFEHRIRCASCLSVISSRPATRGPRAQSLGRSHGFTDLFPVVIEAIGQTGADVEASVVSRLRFIVHLAEHLVHGVDDRLRLIQLDVVP